IPEHRVLEENSWQRTEADAGRHCIRDAGDRTVTHDDSRGDFNLSLRALENPGVGTPHGNAIVLLEILWHLRGPLALQILARAANVELYRPPRASEEPRRQRARNRRPAQGDIVPFLHEIEEPVLE